MRNKTFIITVFFCLLPLLCKGQFCKLYTTHGEISSSMINNIYQDQKGYIWVTTEDGLNKFDGAKFTSYRTHKNDSTSLIGNHVYKYSKIPEVICTFFLPKGCKSTTTGRIRSKPSKNQVRHITTKVLQSFATGIF